jgi:hypothetical protein
MIALTIENRKVGMKVVINPEKIEHYIERFTEGKLYIIENFNGQCIYIRDDNNDLRVMYTYRFYIYEEPVEMIKVNDYVKRKDGVEGVVINIYPSGLIRLSTKKGTYKKDGFIKTVPPVDVPVVDYALLDKLAIGSGQGVCSYVVVGKDDVKYFARNQACASSLGAYGVITKNKIKTIGFNISRYLDRVGDYKKEFNSFLKYVVFESPWSKYYVKDTIENILKKGIFLDVNHPHSHVVAAHIALRIGYEHSSSRLKVFQEAIDQGFSGHVAFIVSQSTYLNPDNVLKALDNNGWHHCMSSQHSVNDIVSFFKNGYKESEEPHTSEGLKRYSIQESIGVQEGNEESVFNLLNSDVINSYIPGAFGQKPKIIKGSFEVAVAKACTLIASKF